MTIHNIDVATLKNWLASDAVTLVDVREPAEWNAGYIPSATLIPLATVPTTPMPVAASKKLVIYCRSGKRSLTACDIVQQLNNSQDVYNLEGGILAWEAASAK